MEEVVEAEIGGGLESWNRLSVLLSVACSVCIKAVRLTDIWLKRKQLNEEKRTEEGRVMLQPDGRGQFQLFESAKESRPPPAYPPIAPGDLRPDARARG